MDILKILGFIFFIPGALTVFFSKIIVDKHNLVEKQKIKLGEEINEETMKMLKTQKANILVKLIGIAILIPGVVLIFIAYK